MGLCLLSACDSNQESIQNQASVVPVLATTPCVKDVPVYLEGVGVLCASVNVDIRPQVSGKVSEVFIAEGDWVVPGTPLFRLDEASYAIKLQEAAAKLATDQATLMSSGRKLERFRSLADKDLISKTEWDELETEAEKAFATVQADKARLSAAQLDLSYCTLTACVEGRIGRLDVHPGQLVSSGQASALASIAKMDPLMVEFSLTEKEVLLLPDGKKELELLSMHAPEIIGRGEVTFLDNHFDSKSGLLTVRGRVPNAAMSLRPGQNVRIRMPVSVIGEAKLIPQKAVKYNQEGPYLYVIGEGNVVQLRKITLGAVQGNQIIISEGLESSDQVITDGHMRIYPGSTVEVKT